MSTIGKWLGRKLPHLRKRRTELVSLVVLLPAPLRLSINGLHDGLARLFPGQFTLGAEGGPDGSFAIVGPDGPTGEPSFFIKSLVAAQRGVFLLHDASSPYTDLARLEEVGPQDELDHAILRHRAWFSVELLQTIGSQAEARAFIAALAGRLAPDDALVLLDPTGHRFELFTDAIRQALLAGGSAWPFAESA